MISAFSCYTNMKRETFDEITGGRVDKVDVRPPICIHGSKKKLIIKSPKDCVLEIN